MRDPAFGQSSSGGVPQLNGLSSCSAHEWRRRRQRALIWPTHRLARPVMPTLKAVIQRLEAATPTPRFFGAEAAPYLLYTAVFALLLWRPKGLVPPRSLA